MWKWKIFICVCVCIGLSFQKPKPDVLDDLVEQLADEILEKTETKASDDKQDCGRKCETTVALVCGSDGATHGNECLMKKRACWSKKIISKVHDGACEGGLPAQLQGLAEGTEPETEKRDEVGEEHENPLAYAERIPSDEAIEKYLSTRRREHGKRSMKKNSEEGNPFDLLEHRAMKRRLKEQERKEKIKAKRMLIKKRKAKPPRGKKPPIVDPNIINPDEYVVHDFDPKSKFAAEKKTVIQKGIKMAHEKIKQMIKKVNMKHVKCNMHCNMYEAQVCGSDGTTYHNKCYMDEIACFTDETLEVANEGRCNASKGTAAENNKSNRPINSIPDMSWCIRPCQHNKVRLCGDDMRTYPDECYLFRHICVTHKKINVLYSGECKINLKSHHLGIPDGE